MVPFTRAAQHVRSDEPHNWCSMHNGHAHPTVVGYLSFYDLSMILYIRYSTWYIESKSN